MSKKQIKNISITLIALIIILGILLPKIFSKKDTEINKNKATQSQIVNISAYILKGNSLNNKIRINGSILGNEEVELKSEISGRIIKIGFKEGTRVKKGDLLVKINDADLQAQLKKSVNNKKLAQEKEFRAKILLEKEGLSKENYDIVLNELNSIIADIDFINAQIEKTEIKAPFDGIIGLRNVSEGAYITPANIIAVLQNNNPVKIDFAIPQKYYDIIKTGNEINFCISANQKQYSAKIYAIDPKIDIQTRTLKVRALCQNNSFELVPGAFIEVELILNNIADAIMIPSESLVPDIDGMKVYIYKNGVAVQQKVEIGTRTDKNVQILSGLNMNDTIITSGIIQLKPNSKVKITNFL